VSERREPFIDIDVNFDKEAKDIPILEDMLKDSLKDLVFEGD
jgi:hypothetical protein